MCVSPLEWNPRKQKIQNRDGRVMCQMRSQSVPWPSPHVVQSDRAIDEASSRISDFLGPSLKGSRKLPNSHLAGPCGLTVEMQ